MHCQHNLAKYWGCSFTHGSYAYGADVHGQVFPVDYGMPGASFASTSASSFPGRPQWAGTAVGRVPG